MTSFEIVQGQNNVVGNALEFTNETINSNIVISVPKDYTHVAPGDDILSTIKIMNLGGSNRMDVVLNFEIRNSNEEVILTKKETIAIETSANLVRIFNVPKDVKEGKYSIDVDLIYADGTIAQSSASFNVVKKKNLWLAVSVFVFVCIIGAVLLFIFLTKSRAWLENRKLKLKIRRIVKNKLYK